MCLSNFMKFRQCLFKILKNQNVANGRTDGRTDGRTNGRTDNVKSTLPTNKVCGGINTGSFFRHAELNNLTSRKLLRIKVTPDLHLTYSKYGGNLGLVLKIKNIACISILLKNM